MKCLLIFILIFSSGESLNKFLKHFEPLNYQSMEMNRVSRSTDERINLHFHAYGRDFKLILRRVQEKDSVFTKDVILEYANETLNIEWEPTFFKGIIEDVEKSHVFGSIRNGIFEGSIEMPNGDEFWVESSSHYNSTSPFHSFIYSMNDIEMPKTSERTKRSDQSNNANPTQFNNHHVHLPYAICNAELHNEELPLIGSRLISKDHKVRKRSTHREPRLSSKDDNGIWSNRFCLMSIQIDYTLYNWVFNGVGMKNRLETRNELYAIVADQVKRVNEIFSEIDFGGVKGITFKTGRIKIWKTAEDKDNPFSKDTTDSEEYLRWHASQDHDKYCLSYIFTSRDFEKGTQGLAYACYLCTKGKLGGNVHTSYNTGMISMRARGNEVPRALWHLTFAHELGHSLGSNHDHTRLASGKMESDENPECGYDKKKGHFIMHDHANDGNKPNHKVFSTCSIKNITRNLKRLLSIDPSTPNDRQNNCLVEKDTPFCGNGIVEKGEICDCGYDIEECLEAEDLCCKPGNDPDSPCTLNNTAKCSPSQGNCCDEKCEFKGVDSICSPMKDCSSEMKCLPLNAKCPEPAPINGGLPCDDATGVCMEGKCDGSICQAEGLEECETSERTCLRYCIYEGECTSTADLNQFSFHNYSQKGRWGHPGIMKKPNVPCGEGKGYCDDFDVCRDVVDESVVSEGKVHNGINSFGELLTENWWIFIIIIIVAILILITAIAVCYYKLPNLSVKSRQCCVPDTTTVESSGELKPNGGKAKPEITAGASSVTGKAPKMNGKWRYSGNIKKKG